MNAAEVAPAAYVPDDDRFLVFGELEEVGGEVFGFAAVAESVGGFFGASV